MNLRGSHPRKLRLKMPRMGRKLGSELEARFASSYNWAHNEHIGEIFKLDLQSNNLPHVLRLDYHSLE